MSDQTPATTVPCASQRLLSLDALRGFDMFWIVGAEDIVHALSKISQRGPIKFLSSQLEHKAWEGVAFYDLIFPLFIYFVGVSIARDLLDSGYLLLHGSHQCVGRGRKSARAPLGLRDAAWPTRSASLVELGFRSEETVRRLAAREVRAHV